MQQDPVAREAFLIRWFRRSREVVKESGGLFVISAVGDSAALSTTAWMSFPDYVICASESAYRILKS